MLAYYGCMAIDLTPEEEAMILRRRNAVARADTLGEQASPAPKGVVWGQVVNGAKTVLKAVFAAAVLTAAFVFLTGFLTAAAAAYPAFGSMIAPVLGFMQATSQGIYGFLGSAGAYLSGGASAGAAGSIGAQAATVAALGGTTAVVAHKAGIAAHAMPDMVSDPAALSAMMNKKHSAVAAVQAPQQVDTNSLLAMPDSPRELFSASEVLQNSQNTQNAQTAAMSKTAAIKTAAHVAADETHEVLKHRNGALERLQQARADMQKASWVDRVSAAPTDALSRS